MRRGRSAYEKGSLRMKCSSGQRRGNDLERASVLQTERRGGDSPLPKLKLERALQEKRGRERARKSNSVAGLRFRLLPAPHRRLNSFSGVPGVEPRALVPRYDSRAPRSARRSQLSKSLQFRRSDT